MGSGERGGTNSEEKGTKTDGVGEDSLRRMALLLCRILIGFIDNPYLPYFYYARENFENYRDGVISKDKKIHILGKIEFFVLPNKVRGKVLIEEHLGTSNMQLMQIIRCYYYYYFFPFP